MNYIKKLEKRVELMEKKAAELWDTNPDGANYYESVIIAPEKEALASAMRIEAEFNSTALSSHE
jgi:hypothetical protein